MWIGIWDFIHSDQNFRSFWSDSWTLRVCPSLHPLKVLVVFVLCFTHRIWDRFCVNSNWITRNLRTDNKSISSVKGKLTHFKELVEGNLDLGSKSWRESEIHSFFYLFEKLENVLRYFIWSYNSIIIRTTFLR